MGALSAGIMPGTGVAQAADVADPSYQVKLRLAPAAIDGNGQPSQAFRSSFTVSPETIREQSVYFDTQDRLYENQGWSIRLRHKEGADSYDVTYKRRIPIEDNSLSKASVERALNEAKQLNFDASDKNYEAQVNSSFNTATLDFSNKKTAACTTEDCSMPFAQHAVEIVEFLEPGKLTTATGGTLADADPAMTAVVDQQTWRVEIDGIKTDLEVSSFAGQKWVEISEEESSRSDAKEKQRKLIAALDRAGLLIHSDAFKTGTVLNTLDQAGR